MAVTLTDAMKLLSRQGFSLVPNKGMVDALSQINRHPNGSYEVRGGRGSQYGGMETRVSRSSTFGVGRDILGGFGRSIGSYFNDPFEFKRKLKENKALSDEAKKNGITLNESALLWNNLRSLFNSSTDYQTSLLSGIFQVIRLQTRYAIAQAKVFGVNAQSLRKPLEDPKKSWFGKIVSSITDDLKKIPGLGLAISAGKNALNIAQFLNPLTMGRRALNLKPGEFIQRLLMGKEGYELAKDPSKAREKAGLNLTDSQRIANLNRAQANYLREQLNVQMGIFRGVQQIVRVMGSDVKLQKLDIGHDEYSGELKTKFGLEQDRIRREGALTAVYQRAAQKSIIGRVTPFFSFQTGKTKKQQIARSKKEKFTEFDAQVITELLKGNGLRDVIESNPNSLISICFYKVMEKTKGRLNFFLEKSGGVAKDSELEDMLFDLKQSILTYALNDKAFRQELEVAQDLAVQRESPLQFAYRTTQRAANVFSNWGGGRDIANTPQLGTVLEASNRYSNNTKYMGIMNRSTDKEILEASLKYSIIPRLVRMIPGIGGIIGLKHGSDLTDAENRVLRTLYKPITDTSRVDSNLYDEILSTSDSNRIPRKTKLVENNAVVNGLRIPNFGNPLTNSFIYGLAWLFLNVPIYSYAHVHEKKRSLAGNIALLASHGDLNGASESAIEREQEIHLRNEEKQIEERHQELISAITEISKTENKKSIDISQNNKSKDKKTGFGIFDWIKDHAGILGIGASLIGNTETGRAIFGFVWDYLIKPTFNGIGSLIFKKLPEWGSSLLGLTVDFAKEHPLGFAGVFSGVATYLFPGTIGRLIGGVLTKLKLTSPIVGLGALAIGGLLNNFFSSKDKSGDDGIFSSTFLKEFLVGSKGGIGNAFGKMGTYAALGASIGLSGGPFGMVGGMLLGGAIGSLIGFIGGDGFDRMYTSVVNSFTKLWDALLGKNENDAMKKYNEDTVKKGGKVYTYTSSFGISEKIGLTLDQQDEYNKLKTEHDKKNYLEGIQREISKKRTGYSDKNEIWRQTAVESALNDLYGDSESGGPDPSNDTFNKVMSLSSGNQLPSSSTSALTKVNEETSNNGSNWLKSMITNTLNEIFINKLNVKDEYKDFVKKSDSEFIDIGSLKFNQNDPFLVTKMFESQGDPSRVAYDVGGGTSYGSFQISSEKGTMKEFLSWCKTHGGEDGKHVYNVMMNSVRGDLNKLNTRAKTGAPVDAWKNLAKSGIITQLENRFFMDVFYPRSLRKLKPNVRKLVESNIPIKQMFISTIVQHGDSGGSGIFNDAFEDGKDEQTFVRKVYELRRNRFKGSYKKSVYERYEKEKNVILQLLAGSSYTGIGSNFLSSTGKSPKLKGSWNGYPNISPLVLNDWSISSDQQLEWPTTSTVITSPAGTRFAGQSASTLHKGIDIRGPVGQPVMASMSGKVISTDPNRWGEVYLQHPNGWISRYMHMSRINVKSGDEISVGQEIGAVGKKHPTYPSMKPHLHFEMIKNGINADPEGVFYQYGKSGGKTAYDQHSYASDISKNRYFESKLRGTYGGYHKPDAVGAGKPNDREGGGPDVYIDPTENRQKKYQKLITGLNESKENLTNGPSTELVDEIKKTNKLLTAQLTIKQQPNISVVQTPQGAVSSGGGSSIGIGEPMLDNTINNLFSTIGNILGDLNIAHTGLSITTV